MKSSSNHLIPKIAKAPLRIAIQGYEGSFHQEAARVFWGKEVHVIPCDTFREVVKIASSKKESDGGMMAIENSIAGSILPNYALLEKGKVQIAGEVYLPIKQHLLANHGVVFDDIRSVHSHPMALLQCTDFLEKHPQLKLVESEDTALSAMHLQQKRSKHAAAIASKLAADLYNLQIVVPNIHTLKNNYTRFLVLLPEAQIQLIETANKASVHFYTDHSRGSLARVLGVIAEGGINLSKLQSVPIPGTEFRYAFHADMEFDNRDIFEKVLYDMKAHTIDLRIFGVYKNGKNQPTK